ncbi:hypothetical protein B0J13DRAFT_662166 [Dactylonectria estremocensis]|uniref:Uncharacterized protein n=1 Tax=Dactylonectria estremocensis TaxID=1079267 RepID=A0A9P9I886_9HYPO|nr:hypothetical protein B0J13DRAFT_662166 [Dactylonectria estremocensis]
MTELAGRFLSPPSALTFNHTPPTPHPDWQPGKPNKPTKKVPRPKPDAVDTLDVAPEMVQFLQLQPLLLAFQVLTTDLAVARLLTHRPKMLAVEVVIHHDGPARLQWAAPLQNRTQQQPAAPSTSASATATGAHVEADTAQTQSHLPPSCPPTESPPCPSVGDLSFSSVWVSVSLTTLTLSRSLHEPINNRARFPLPAKARRMAGRQHQRPHAFGPAHRPLRRTQCACDIFNDLNADNSKTYSAANNTLLGSPLFPSLQDDIALLSSWQQSTRWGDNSPDRDTFEPMSNSSSIETL